MIEGLAESDRATLAALWQSRAESESSVRSVFEKLVRELSTTGAHHEVIALAERAAADEARHADICVELASVYRGTRIEAPPTTARLPDYDVPPRLRTALHAVNLCCIGETIATAFVQACLADCASAELRELHGRHLADEVHHARVGWAHLASLSVDERAQIAAHLPELLRAQLTAWESAIAELPEHGLPGHGYPPRAALLATVHGAVRELVLAGFDYLAVDTTAARAWLTAR